VKIIYEWNYHKTLRFKNLPSQTQL
jgi:hypothetical protein